MCANYLDGNHRKQYRKTTPRRKAFMMIQGKPQLTRQTTAYMPPAQLQHRSIRHRQHKTFAIAEQQSPQLQQQQQSFLGGGGPCCMYIGCGCG